MRDMGDYDLVDRYNDADFNLSNNIHIHYFADNSETGFQITTYSGEIIDATKWLTYSSYDELVSLFDKTAEHNIPRDIDKVYFDMFKSIVGAVYGSNINLLVDIIKSNNDNDYALVEVTSQGKPGNTIFARTNSSGDTIAFSKFIDNVYYSTYDLERAFRVGYGYNAKDIIARSLIDLGFSLADAHFDFVQVSNARQILDERPDYILFEMSYNRNLKVPLTYLDSVGIEYGYCFYSNQPVVTASISSYIPNLPYNIFGRGLPRLSDSDVALSNRVFEYNVSENYCQDCDSTYDVIDYNFYYRLIDDAPFSERDRIRAILDDNFTTEDNDSGYCSSCESRHEDISVTIRRAGVSYHNGNITLSSGGQVSIHDGSSIMSYDYRPDFYLQHLADEADADLHLGVELEIDKGGNSHNSAKILTAIMGEDTYAMHDGSLTDGFEIATMPATLSYHMNYINYEEAFKVASSLGYRAHDTRTCGIHVHINRRFFGSSRSTQGIKAAFMTLMLERNWEDVVKFSRRDYRNLEEWAKSRNLEDDVYSDDTDGEIIDKFYDKYDDKYVAINTQHSHSYEIRIFRGTLRYETYIATLQFVSNLAHIAKECTTLTRAQQITFDDIVNYNRYPELVNYLATRGMQVESDTMPVLQPESEAPTLFDVVA